MGNPDSSTLFTITVQEPGGSPARLAGQRRITVPLRRLQSTQRRLCLAGATILAVTRCTPIGDPPASPVLSNPQPEALAPSPHPQEQMNQEAVGAVDQDSIAEDVMVVLLSLVGLGILLTIQLAQRLARQWQIDSQPRQRPDPPAVRPQVRELTSFLKTRVS